jgi:predicted ArsR family transcriptional regulator
VSTIQVQARALGDPTRHGIFEYLVDADRPVDVAELTTHFGVNHNAIRQHLAKLVDADLVVERTAPITGRGRPRLQYVVDPSTESRWGVVGPYERLSMLLAEIVHTGDTPVEVGRRAGRRVRLSVAAASEPVDAFVAQLARHGFEPSVVVRGDTVEVILEHCPFVSAVLTDADTVCELHRGLAEGYADAVGGGLVVEELIPKDPRPAHCRLRCRLPSS